MLQNKALIYTSALLLLSCAGGLADDPTENLTGTETQPLAGGPGAPPTCPSPKVMICHIPPGNPANAHSICVGEAAVKAHVANHGDPIGPCGGAPAVDAGSPAVPPVVPPTPAADAGIACIAFNAACTSTSQCCGTMICLGGEAVCGPLIE